MDAELLERAQTVLDRANQCLIDLGATKNLDEIEMHWAYFLVNFERIFHRIAKAAGGPGDAWYGAIEQFRKDDPLLRYLRHARNADEHGVKDVTQKLPGQLRAVDARLANPADAKGGVVVTMEVLDPYLALENVVDRGVVYNVPESFRGAPISKAHPLNVGLLGLSYAEEVLSKARSRV